MKMKQKSVITRNFKQCIQEVIEAVNEGYTLIERDGMAPYHMIAGTFQVHFEKEDDSAHSVTEGVDVEQFSQQTVAEPVVECSVEEPVRLEQPKEYGEAAPARPSKGKSKSKARE